jgi:hypothetical protein
VLRRCTVRRSAHAKAMNETQEIIEVYGAKEIVEMYGAKEIL